MQEVASATSDSCDPVDCSPPGSSVQSSSITDLPTCRRWQTRLQNPLGGLEIRVVYLTAWERRLVRKRINPGKIETAHILDTESVESPEFLSRTAGWIPSHFPTEGKRHLLYIPSLVYCDSMAQGRNIYKITYMYFLIKKGFGVKLCFSWRSVGRKNYPDPKLPWCIFHVRSRYWLRASLVA